MTPGQQVEAKEAKDLLRYRVSYDAIMRTTVTLDPDAERILRAALQDRGVSLKQALNDAIRTGLTKRNSRQKRRFIQKTYSLGPLQHFHWDKALAAADAIEDEELIRKVERSFP